MPKTCLRVHKFSIVEKSTVVQRFLSDLLHWVLHRTLPVIIVIVDVSEGAVYWAAAEKSASDLSLRKKDWRHQKSVTLLLAKSNRLPLSIDRLEAFINFKAAIVRGIALDKGMLLFDGIDDFIFAKLPRPGLRADWKISLSMKLLDQTRCNGTVWSLCVQSEAKGSLHCKKRFEAVLSLSVVLDGGSAYVQVKLESDSRTISFNGPILRPAHFERVSVEVTDSRLRIVVGEGFRTHKLVESLKAGSVLMLGAEGSSASGGTMNNLGFYAADVEAINPRTDELISHWTFPKIDPGIDVSGNMIRARFPGFDSYSIAQSPIRLACYGELTLEDGQINWAGLSI